MIEFPYNNQDGINLIESNSKALIRELYALSKKHDHLKFSFDIIFNEKELLKKQNRTLESEKIFNYINSFDGDETFLKPKPKSIISCSVIDSFNTFSIIRGSVRSGEKINMIPLIKNTIHKKNQINYRKEKYDELWLLIVNEQTIHSENYTIQDNYKLLSEEKGDWNRVFVLDRIFTKIYEL